MASIDKCKMSWKTEIKKMKGNLVAKQATNFPYNNYTTKPVATAPVCEFKIYARH